MYKVKYGLSLTFEIEEEECEWSAICPELGVASCGINASEAEKMLREAVGLYVRVQDDLGQLSGIVERLVFSDSPSYEFQVDTAII